MSTSAIFLEYQARIVALHATASQLRLGQAVALAVMATMLAILILAFFSIARRTVPLPGVFFPLPFTIYSGRVFRQRSSALLETLRLETFYEQGIARLEGRWTESARGGEEFARSGHCYGEDLHVFGKGSLFQLLCTCRTEVGRRQLANYLLDTPTLEEAARRQDAVKELRDRSEVREQISLLGDFSSQESTWKTVVEWLDSPAVRIYPGFHVLAFGTSISLAVLLLLGVASLVAWGNLLPWIGSLLALSGTLGLFYRTRILAALPEMRSVSAEVGILRQGLSLLQGQKFNSSLLTQLVESASHGDPPSRIRKLERLMGTLIDRDKEWFYAVSRVLLIGTHMFLAIESWRARHGRSMRDWLRTWGEFEALAALANYAYEHPEDRFPEFAQEQVTLECKGIGHPLLPLTKCIRNDISFNRDLRFYIISGSNMAGKSTLLRAIGLNAVLAYAGAPVRAESMVLSRFSICASVGIQDSLMNGRSKFLAEIDRLKQALNIPPDEGPVLFLIDEILSGTNSIDRKAAAKAILTALIQQNAIGALSTHDLALTELVMQEDLRGANVHMGSKDDADPMNFDYIVKPGIANQSSALAIARLAGVSI